MPSSAYLHTRESVATAYHDRHSMPRLQLMKLIKRAHAVANALFFQVLESCFKSALFLHFRRLLSERVVVHWENSVLVLASADVGHG